MKRFSLLAVLLSIALVGCPAPEEQTAVDDGAAVAEPAVDGNNEPAVPETASDSASAFQLTSDNTLIQFVGVHTDPEKPDPRTGHFETFSGSAKLSADVLQAVTVEIDTTSLTTDIDKLTNHLKSGDFFNVNEFPKATFQSTSISGGDGKATITGNLTLLGTTKMITFPATYSTTDGFALDAQFTIDRTEFGMDFGTDNVKKEVEMTIKTPK